MRVQFQSTHSLRSATPKVAPMAFSSGVSIHALLAECDDDANRKFEELIAFQSTHSLRSATFTWEQYAVFLVVSIHALLAECDRCGGKVFHLRQRFNPRTPCGVRLLATGNNVRCDRDHGKGVNLG